MYTERMDFSSGKRLALIAIILGLANLLIVGWIFWEQQRVPAPEPSVVQLKENSPQAPESPTATASSASFDETLAEIENRLVALEKRSPAPVAKSTNGIKETFLYMGTGSSTSREWTTIDSASITFNPSTYGNIKEVRFEAGLSIISGEVSARLINKNSGAVYYDSTVTHNLSASEWKTSAPIYLPSGSATYAVQLRSSNGERANLDGARLKIMVQ